MSEEKRTEREKATRHERIQEALNERKQKGYSNKYGMTAAQIRNVLGKTKTQENRLPPLVKQKGAVSSRSKVVRGRPKKLSRRPRKDNNHRLLLEVPVMQGINSFEYPTPNWLQKSGKADVSVIVPLYKSDKHITNLINSWDLDEPLNVELILVDDCCPNNSKEVALKAWNKRKSQVKNPIGRIMFSSVNQGFGMTCNTGAYHATGEYLIFLNADTRVTKGWIKPMIRMLKKPDVGLVGNMHLKLHGPWHGRINSAGSEWNWETMTFRHRGWEQYNQVHLSQPFTLENMPEELKTAHEVEMVTGACLAIRKKDFQEIGGFNPNYRIGYWEDSELSLSVREKGLKVMFQPNSTIWHEAGHSNSGGHKHASHNTNYFINKWVNSGRIDPLVTAKRSNPVPTVRDILIRRREAHGDVLVASGVISALKKKYPDARILFNTNHRDIIEDHPDVERVLKDSEVSERLFQLYFNLDMAYEYRPYTNMLAAYAELCGVRPKDCKPFLKPKHINGLPKEYTVIHVGASMWPGRIWTPMKFDLVANRLRAAGRKVVCVGGGSDHGTPCDLDLRGKTSIRELGYVIKNADMFIGVDSLPMHIAQTFDVPGVAFFGCIDPKTRLYSDKMVPVVAEGLSCLGCHHEQPAPQTSLLECKMGHQDCISKVSVERMMKKIEEVWNGNKQSIYETAQ